MTRIAVGAAALVLGIALLSGCGQDDVELVEGVREPVDALDNSFAPEEVAVRAGTEIVFHNVGRNEHNVIPAEDGEDWAVDTEELPPGGPPVGRRFTEPGTYGYFCSIHGTADAGMVGTITVEG